MEYSQDFSSLLCPLGQATLCRAQATPNVGDKDFGNQNKPSNQPYTKEIE